ncbi:hypothetical protein JMJ77_0014203 [Colletotrichum scovillei]|uniref:Uncharacterized protein n=1 Tax=Colletotrichum scovillei TaxID=1209932 RepID=A0A9P7UH84_9PEZI|nr:hypothetical protein JMJ77_0014203 [Colletotrichum scovillei]KAG7065731.1 hypothetical protein JMJ78_0012479 [Colletotrichum scovillei]KAG7068331.1 hypothetical protein JMJ76_0008022 [Colletotrichum scovillei]
MQVQNPAGPIIWLGCLSTGPLPSSISCSNKPRGDSTETADATDRFAPRFKWPIVSVIPGSAQ